MLQHWTFDLVEERMVEAAALWRRSPADGHLAPRSGNGFATDAPWQLLTRIARADNKMDAWRIEQDELAARDDTPKRIMGLTPAEVARRDQASGWLALVAEKDRRLVALAVAEQAATGRRVDWMRMRSKMDVVRGANGLRMRYERALGRLAIALNRQQVPVDA